MRTATEQGRAARADIEVGICGEHGGDPSSIDFCESLGLDYVSASPFRVPVARIAAAHARLEQGFRDRKLISRYRPSRQVANIVVRRHPDAQAFLSRTRGFLAEREAENVLMLGVACSATEAEHALTVDRGGVCVMAALQSGANLVLSRGQAGAVEALVRQLSQDDSSLPGVIGPARTTASFVDSWHARTGHETRFQMHSRTNSGHPSQATAWRIPAGCPK